MDFSSEKKFCPEELKSKHCWCEDTAAQPVPPPVGLDSHLHAAGVSAFKFDNHDSKQVWVISWWFKNLYLKLNFLYQIFFG